MSTKEERDKDPYMWRMVRTTQPNLNIDDYTPEAKLARKWNVRGHVQDLSNSHGLSYQVMHTDGSVAWYDPSELEVTDNGIDRARNKLVNAIFANKTIREVDATSANDTQISMEVDTSMGLSISVISEEPGWDPKETMGPGRKPGDARKELAQYDWDDLEK